MAVFEIQLGLLASLQFVVFVFVTGGILGYLAALHAFKQYREKTVRIKAIEKLSNATPEELKYVLFFVSFGFVSLPREPLLLRIPSLD